MVCLIQLFLLFLINAYGGYNLNLNFVCLQFVDDKVQWMHVDMAGPVWDKKHGATAFGVSTLVEWILSNSC